MSFYVYRPAIREFLADYNRRTGATILLTSHYMADVEALCRRVIVIHHGKLLFDGQLARLVASFASHKTVTVELAEPRTDLSEYGEVIAREDLRAVLRVPKSDTPRLTARLLAELPVLDLSVDPHVQLPTNTTAGIASDGMLGGAHVRLEPGNAKQYLPAGGRIAATRDYRSLEELVGEIIFLATGQGASQQ